MSKENIKRLHETIASIIAERENVKVTVEINKKKKNRQRNAR